MTYREFRGFGEAKFAFRFLFFRLVPIPEASKNDVRLKNGQS